MEPVITLATMEDVEAIAKIDHQVNVMHHQTIPDEFKLTDIKDDIDYLNKSFKTR